MIKTLTAVTALVLMGTLMTNIAAAQSENVPTGSLAEVALSNDTLQLRYESDAEPVGVVGDGLGVVAGRHGHHPSRPLVGVELEQLVQRAPLLERGDELEVLELHDDVAAQQGGQGPRVGAGRAGHRRGP